MRNKKLVIATTNLKSRGLKALAKALTERVGYHVYRVSPARVRSRIPVVFHSGVDKREQLRRFCEGNVPSPKFALHGTGTNEWDCRRVVVRALTRASEGRGITICNKGDTLPVAPLYTEYIPKKKEFRVHIWNNEVIDVAEKRKRTGYESIRDTQIRNTANGYVFCRTGITEPDGLRSVALSAVSALSRSHGAVDMIWNEKRNKCYVLEVNSQPGMEGTTVQKYADAIVRAAGVRSIT